MSQQGKMSLSVKDVIHIEGFPGSASLFQDNATLRIKDLLSKLEAVFSQSGMLSADEVRALMQQGIPCEMLQPGAGDWQAGSLRISLDFQPSASAPATAASMNLPAIAVAPMMTAPMSAVAAMPDASMALDSMMTEDAIGAEDVLSDDADDLMGGLMIDEVTNLQDALNEDAFSEDGLSEETEMEMPEADLADAIDFSDDLVMDDVPMAKATEESDFSDLMDESMMESAMEDDAAIDLSDVDFMSIGEEATELEFGLDLDSQMVDAETADNLGNPWDPNAELDEMLLANGHNL